MSDNLDKWERNFLPGDRVFLPLRNKTGIVSCQFINWTGISYFIKLTAETQPAHCQSNMMELISRPLVTPPEDA